MSILDTAIIQLRRYIDHRLALQEPFRSTVAGTDGDLVHITRPGASTADAEPAAKVTSDLLVAGDEVMVQPVLGKPVVIGKVRRTAAPGTPDPTIADHETRITTTEISSSVLAALRFDPAHPNYGAVRGTGVSAAVRTANTAAINLAASDAAAAGGTLVIKGEYEIDGTLYINCDVDGAGAILYAPQTLNPAVLVGGVSSGQIGEWLIAALPEVISDRVTGGGVWSTGVGVECRNLNNCLITMSHIKGFGVNVKITALGAGNAYNTYSIAHLNNGKINQLIEPQTEGWVNENLFQINRYSHYTAEGTNISGVRHIKIGSNGVNSANNNLWVKPSIEGNAPEFHIEMIFAYDNRVIQGRYEADPPKVRLENTVGIVFDGGYGLGSVQFTEVNTKSTSWLSRNMNRIFGAPGDQGVVVIENQSSSSNPALVVMPTGSGMGANPATSYAWQIGTQWIRGKAGADAFPRFQVDSADGRLYMGNGAASPSLMMRVGGSGSSLGPYLDGAKVYTAGPIQPQAAGPQIHAGAGTPEGVVTAPKGSIYMRSDGGAGTSMYVKESGTGNTGWVAK